MDYHDIHGHDVFSFDLPSTRKTDVPRLPGVHPIVGLANTIVRSSAYRLGRRGIARL